MSTITNEEWRPVVGYEGFYEVSNTGRVKRIAPAMGARVGRILKPATSGLYPGVVLTRDSIQITKPVHILVASAFIGARPKGFQVNHKDGLRNNNHVSNLEYVTPSENIRHAWRLGLIKPLPIERHVSRLHPERVARGTRNSKAKLDDDKVREIRQLTARGITRAELGRKYGVTPAVILYAATKRTWKHVEDFAPH